MTFTLPACEAPALAGRNISAIRFGRWLLGVRANFQYSVAERKVLTAAVAASSAGATLLSGCGRNEAPPSINALGREIKSIALHNPGTSKSTLEPQLGDTCYTVSSHADEVAACVSPRGKTQAACVLESGIILMVFRESEHPQLTLARRTAPDAAQSSRQNPAAALLAVQQHAEAIAAQQPTLVATPLTCSEA
jgi:hypothetical protein